MHISNRFLAVLVLSFAATAAFAAASPKSQPPLWSAKPDVPAFEKVENDRLGRAQKSLDALITVKGTRTVDNTLAPFDEAIRQINAAQYFASLMLQVHPDAKFRDSATQMLRQASAASTALSLNRDAYRALSSLDVSKADAATQYYVKRYLLLFRLAGVDKDDATRAKLRQLQDQLTEQQATFDRNISDGQKAVEVASASELEGLPQDYIERHKPGADGKIRITTDYPDIYPALTFAKSDDLRRRLSLALNTRAYPKNRDVLKNMMQTRYEIATLLGYPSWADYFAADKMVGKGKRIGEFIREVDAAARPVAQREMEMLLAEKRKFHPEARDISTYETAYLEELVKRSQFKFDSQVVRPYFPYAKVKQGILDTAAKLFQVSFRQESHVPAWDPTVETWDVFDQGKMIGRFYLDMHPRAGKFSHAEMAPVLDGIRGKQLPEAVLVCNFPGPTASDPGLMDYDDVVTFFHEFGHLMHWILGGQQQWAGISGISMESDFGEAPSQMLEEWMRSPQVLASFAHHYRTGEPIPADLVTTMNRASAFGRGTWVARQNTYTAISYDIYKIRPQDVDLDAVCDQDTVQYSRFVPLPGAHMYASFGHLGGYSSAYYTYLWDKVIAEDFFLQFDRKNLLGGEAPMRYRRLVLEPGGSMSANDLVKNFLGRTQNMTALQQWMGEALESTDGSQQDAGH